MPETTITTASAEYIARQFVADVLAKVLLDVEANINQGRAYQYRLNDADIAQVTAQLQAIHAQFDESGEK